MKRYYLSKIKQINQPGIGMVWVHRFQEATTNTNYVGGEIAVDLVTGIPTQKALLILVEHPNHSAFIKDAELADFPEVALDTKANAVGVGARNASKEKMRAIGLSAAEVDDLWLQADSVRDIVDRMGRLNNPAFDSRDFDVS
jgi:hypothetical protein